MEQRIFQGTHHLCLPIGKGREREKKGDKRQISYQSLNVRGIRSLFARSGKPRHTQSERDDSFCERFSRDSEKAHFFREATYFLSPILPAFWREKNLLPLIESLLPLISHSRLIHLAHFRLTIPRQVTSSSYRRNDEKTRGKERRRRMKESEKFDC